MATATRARKTTTRRTTTQPTPTRRAGCQCLDLPRMHARGDDGCTHEYDTNTIHVDPAAAGRRASHAAQQEAFLRDLGTPLTEIR